MQRNLETWHFPEERQRAVEPDLPSESDFLRILATNKLPRERELDVRFRAWWAANDPHRMNKSAAATFSPEQTANLRALFNLLDDKVLFDRLTKAEILRELKEYAKCLKLLEQPYETKIEWPDFNQLANERKNVVEGVENLHLANGRTKGVAGVVIFH